MLPPQEPPLPLPHLLLLGVTPHGMEYPFGGFRSAALGMSPPHLLPTPSLLAPGGLEGVLMWCQYRAAIGTTSCDTSAVLATSAEHSAVWAAAGKVNFIPAR